VQFQNKRYIFKNMFPEIMDSVVVWTLAKQMCMSLQNFVMLLGLDFIPPNQIANMSLNGLRRKVETRDKTQTQTQMEKMSIALDMGHRVSASGTHLLSFCFPKKSLLEDLSN
jgi:hypothetical protein